MTAATHAYRPATGPVARDHLRAIMILVALGILAGILLRMSGFVGGAYSWFFLSGAGDDSWMPMRLAYERAIGMSPGSVTDLFFVDNVKFQYPPSSLLLFAGYELLGITPTDRAMNVLVWLSVLATVPLVFFTTLVYAARNRATLGFSHRQELLVAATFAVATLFFYPIMIAWRLGQVQALLNMLFAAACLAWLLERRTLSGVLIGVICLIKPQFSLFLVWGLLRRQHGFVLGQAVVIGLGLALSVTLFGWRPHLGYLQVLSFISHHGEIFWDNTSVNGLLNRVYHPDQALIFDYHGWPPYVPLVYAATLVSSLAILGFALLLVGRSGGRGSVLDLMTAAFCFTLAAPIAWGHHFGIAMPIFAVLLLAAGAHGTRQRSAAFLVAALCYLAFSNYWNVSELLAGTDFAVLQSWRFFAALAMLWLLYRAVEQAGPAASGSMDGVRTVAAPPMAAPAMRGTAAIPARSIGS